MNKKNLKSGTSLLFMLGFMAVIASVFGYFISSWFLDYVTAPKEEINSVANNRTVKEERIDPQQKNNSQSTTESTTDKDIGMKSKTKEGQGNQQSTIKPQANSDLFAVQVGAFSKKENAEGLVDRLQNNGFTAYITTKNPYRVQVGAFKTKDAAQELGDELKKIGFPVYINH